VVSLNYYFDIITLYWLQWCMEQGHICGDCGYSAGLAFQVKKKI